MGRVLIQRRGSPTRGGLPSWFPLAGLDFARGFQAQAVLGKVELHFLAQLEELAQQGFIRLDETVTVTGIKSELIEAAKQTLGADAEKIIAKIKDAPETREGLLATISSCKKLVKLVIDEKKAEELILKCSEIMSRL